MTSSSVICEPFNSDTQYSALSSIDLNTTNSTITVTSIDNITTTCETITPNTSITTTFMNEEESSMVHEDNNSPVRCKSLETKLPEKYLTHSSTKKRHRSTIDNQWNRSTSLNSLTNLKLHNTKTPLTLSLNGEQRQHEEFDIISKKRKTTENIVIHTDSNDSEQPVYNHELKTFEYGSVYDYPQPKSINYHHPHERQQKNRQINSNENFSEINSCEQVENKESFNETHQNRAQLKHLSSPSSSSSSVLSLRKNYSNENQMNALNDSTNDTCSNHPEDEGDNELSSASELTTAAYNNFVRRVVDDTLDRTVTFCEQPRHAITALENICTRAWPQLEVKRHRNRIRAYLKACRRNSKKNKGQINMKEPPANGLSIEARQLVSKALLLVADDLDYLKQAMQAERTKNKSIFSTKMDGSREKSYFACSNNNNNNNSNTRSPNHSLKMDLSNPSDFGDVYNQKHDLPTLLENSNNSSNEKLKSNKNLWNTPHNLLNDIMTNNSSNTSAFPFTDPLLWSNSLLQNTNLDSNYLAAAAAALAAVNPANILKLLPAALQLNNHNNSLNLSTFNSNTNRSNINNENSNHLGMNNYHEGKHGKTTNERHPTRKLSHTWCDDEFTSNQHQMNNCSVNNDNDNNNCTSPNLSENKSFSSDSHFSSVGLETSKHSSFNNFGGASYLSDCFNNNDAAYCSPPPAHTSSIQYSPTINQALDRLTDTGLLTHDDVEFFLQNPEVTKAAIKQARCQSYLILKKIEIVENQIKSSLNSSKIMPLNLS
uniref:Nucleolar protein 4 helical domain-containing protein n=1 Tax=Trichobilharzia regenti TaxID=157069 RepID=A0AA85K2R9_TRIRE|nr:unnamed protein product [Trichobilharzia regenti]